MAAARPRPGDVDRVVGGNVRARREALGASQDDLAQALRDRGWVGATGQVLIAIEAGNRSLRLNEVLLLADALNVPLAALLDNAGEHVALGWGLSDRDPARRLTSAPRRLRIQGRAPRSWGELEGLRRQSQFAAGGRGHSVGDESQREAEQHAARRLGVPAEEVVRRSYEQWGRTLSEKRDALYEARAPVDATPRQRATIRGHVTRELLDELRQDIEHETEERE